MDARDAKAEPTRRWRWTPWAVSVASVGLLFALVLFGPYLLFKVPPIRAWVLDVQVRELLGEGYRLGVEDVRRLDVGGFILVGVELEARDTGGVWHRVGRADHLSATWSPIAALTGEIRIYRLEATPLSIFLPGLRGLRGQDKEGEREEHDAPSTLPGLRLPWGLPRITVRQLRLAPVAIVDSAGVVAHGGLLRSELTLVRQELIFLIREASVSIPGERILAHFSDARLHWRAGKGELHGLTVSGDRVRGVFHATYDPAETAQPLRVDAALERLDPLLISRHLLPALVIEPGDSLSGGVQLTWRPDAVDIDFVLAGRLLGEACSECSALLTIAPGSLRFDTVVIRADAGRVRGEGAYMSGARELSLSADWVGLDLHSAWLPWLSPLPVRAPIEGAGSATVHLPERGSPSVTGRVRLRGARPWDLGLGEIDFRGTVRFDESIEVDSLHVSAGSGELRARGIWPLGDGQADGIAELDSVSVDVLPERWRAGLSGRVSGQVHLGGPRTDPVLEGALRAEGMSRGAWRAALLTVGSLLFWPRDLRGSATADLWGLRREGGETARVSARISRWNEWLSFTSDLRVKEEDVHLEARLDPAGRLVVDRGSLLSPRVGDWRLEKPFRFAWSPDTLRADSLHLASNGARLRAGGIWVRSTGAIEASLTVDSLRTADLAGILGPNRHWGGTSSLRLRINGALPDPYMTLRFEADSLVAGRFDLGRVSLQAGWVDSVLTVGPVTLQSAQHEVNLPYLRFVPDRSLLSLLGAGDDGTSLIDRLSTSSWSGRIEVERLDLARWGAVFGLGRGGNERRAVALWREVGGRPVPIRIVAPWDLGPATAGAGGLGGELAAVLEVEGTPGEPILAFEGSVDSLSVAGVHAGELTLDLRYAGEQIGIDWLGVTVGDDRSWVEGTYPFALRLLPFRAEPLTRPVAITSQIRNLGVAPLSGFTRWVPDATGRVSGDLRLFGDGTRPDISGRLQLTDGGFRVPGRSERVYEARADAVLSSAGLELRAFEARSGPKGTITATGSINRDREIDLQARAHNIRIFEHGQYEFIATADDIRISTRRSEDDPGFTGRLIGRVEVLAGTMTPDLGGGGGGGAERELPWEVDLDVVIPNRIRVSQTNAQVDLGEGQMHVTYRAPRWNASGNLKILGGTYRLFNNNFTIRDGTVDLRESVTGPEVTVLIDGETYVMLADTTASGAAGNVRVEVRVEGKPDELQITLTSDPPYSPEEIATLLSYGRFLTETGHFQTQRLGQETQGVLFNEIFRRIELSVNDQIPMRTSVAIETGTGDDLWRPRRVRLQQMITPQLTGNYTLGVYEGTNWELSLQYRLSRILYLRAGMVRDRESRPGYNDIYSLDLRCYFEYE